MSPNRLRALREARGLSQIALAAAASLSRQSIGAIEAGRAVPGVDVALRLARVLDTTVEELFGAAPSEQTISTEPWGATRPGRVALAKIGGRWVSYALHGGALRAADGIAGAPAKGRVAVEPVRPIAESAENLIVMGCAAALGVLAARSSRVVWIPSSSTRALEALASRRTHLAGVHLVDGRTGEANVPDVRRHAGEGRFVLITLARWEAGLVIAPERAKTIRGPGDLGRRGIRIVTREPGSGARRLLDRALRDAGCAPPSFQASGHLEVAHAVSLGAADAGIATRDAAIAYGLDFVALAEERYDLVVPRALLADPRVERFFDVMTAGPSRRELAALGYDVSSCGTRVAEVSAA
ncbi:substrate-binding domain-containing protein [Sandaracinus amylolyticus]|uniref:substrate-binding domain-containing protein n=1 Tax=Sandaracinus amylolyticus TaxID=927083 RepID=UPI001F2EC1C6|nr:substrate-binding domain-containing protein [Sandaracinus amylolyticus]UJR85746.1 Hypothetical protein I5071_78260 [Sandaracinus amylolyticus]